MFLIITACWSFFKSEISVKSNHQFMYNTFAPPNIVYLCCIHLQSIKWRLCDFAPHLRCSPCGVEKPLTRTWKWCRSSQQHHPQLQKLPRCTSEMRVRWWMKSLKKQQRWHPNVTELDTLQSSAAPWCWVHEYYIQGEQTSSLVRVWCPN